MNSIVSLHNVHWDNPKKFAELDPHLRKLNTLKYVFESPLLKSFPDHTPGVYILGGGRQIGKTTFLKQWINHLLKSGVTPKSIAFLTGELIDDHHRLMSLIMEVLGDMPKSGSLNYLIIDEVTYIKDWDKAIKFLADSGFFENCEVVLTGSDLVLMNEAAMRFPGRRGTHKQVDFHYSPLSFREYVDLIHPASPTLAFLYEAFQHYLIHGGFLTAINDWAKHGEILESTAKTYSDWIRVDFLKRGKKEQNLRDFLQAVLKTYGTQITWHTLTHHTAIDHPKTIQDYAELMQSMDGLFIQEALIEHKLLPAPKKAKRLFFSDPFVYHALRLWLEPQYNPLEALKDSQVLSSLVETAVINGVRRSYPTYYIKAEGEVDLAYVIQKKFYPIEIKWTGQIRPQDLKQIKKYENGKLWARVQEPHKIGTLSILPLPKALYEFA
jgi:predicted AAA+ superfamily ATPase